MGDKRRQQFEDKNDPTGFPNRTDSTISFTDGTRVFSIQPTGATFEYYDKGINHKTDGDTLVITDVEGIHIIYYDGKTLTEFVNPNSGQAEELIRTKALCCIIYWNAIDSEGIYVGEERHGMQMDGSSHAYLHFHNGLIYLYGLGLNTMSVDGTGVTADAQFGIDLGGVADEDLFINISAVVVTSGLPLYYMLGASARWVEHIEAGFSIRTFDGTTATRLAYNEYTGGAWQLTEESNGDFVLYHIFATTEKDNPMLCIMGQNGYATKRAARAGAETEIYSLVLDNILFPEIRPIATLIYQTKLAYANDVNARIVSTDEGDDYIDWRNEAISRTYVSGTDHNNLSGLQGGAPGEYYHLPEGGVEKGVSRLTASANTTLTTAGTWYKIAGTFANNSNNLNFTTDANNKITYDGVSSTFLFAGASDVKVSSACQIIYGLYKNGVLVAEAQTPHDFTSASKTENISITSIIDLVDNDYLEVYAKSDIDSITLTVETLLTTYWGSK